VPSFGGSAALVAGGVGLWGAAARLFYSSRPQGMSKALDKLALDARNMQLGYSSML
jgi:hypothetical protein